MKKQFMRRKNRHTRVDTKHSFGANKNVLRWKEEGRREPKCMSDERLRLASTTREPLQANEGQVLRSSRQQPLPQEVDLLVFCTASHTHPEAFTLPCPHPRDVKFKGEERPDRKMKNVKEDDGRTMRSHTSWGLYDVCR